MVRYLMNAAGASLGRSIGIAIGAATFAVLASGCASEHEEAEYQYGASEVRPAIEGTWTGREVDESAAGNAPLPNTDGSPMPVTLTLSYKAADAHPLCGNRVLSGGATLEGNVSPRCEDISTMNIEGAFRSAAKDEQAVEQAVRGSFEVWSLRFDGDGSVSLDMADGRQLSGELLDGVMTLRTYEKGTRSAVYALSRAR